MIWNSSIRRAGLQSNYHMKRVSPSSLFPHLKDKWRSRLQFKKFSSSFHNLGILQASCNGIPYKFFNVHQQLGRHIHTDVNFRYHRSRSKALLYKCHPIKDILENRISLFRSIHMNQIFRKHDVKHMHTDTPEDQDPSLAYLRTGKQYFNGPDQLMPSNAMYTWHARGAVQLGKLVKGPGHDRPPVSIPTMFLQSVETQPNVPALATKIDGKWKFWNYEEYYEDCRRAAKAFIALGLERFHSVCILGVNAPEWFMANMGTILAGGIPTGIYTTNSASACAFIAEDSRANVYVVEDEKQLSKILQHRTRLPHLRAIVQYSGKPSCEGVLSWEQFMKLGELEPDKLLDDRIKQIAVNQCATLIYTSGTTGSPKGVMLSHDNITWLCHQVVDYARFGHGHEEVVSYLPLSHIAAQTADIYFPMLVQGTVYFAGKDALQGSLINTLREVQPTKFLAVPRVWEKMFETLRDIGSKNTGLKLKISSWAKKQGTMYNKKRLAGDPDPSTIQFLLADKIVLSQIKKALGLSRCNLSMSCAAPISVDILEYFMSLNIMIGEAYGLSECSGPHTLAVPGSNYVRFGSIGLTVPGSTSKLDRPTADGQGELCIGGRHLLMGYLHRENTTKEAFDNEGWFHTEDMARIDEDGYVYITGRIKELLITAGGENVAPVPIEDTIKLALPCLSHAVVIGDRLKYLTVLMTFKCVMNNDTNEPLEKLAPSSKEWIEKHGNCSVNTIKDLLDEVYKKENSKNLYYVTPFTQLINAINSGVMLANTKAVSRAQKVQKWVILPKEFSLPGGEIGPTMKLKRKVVFEKYKDLIEEIYKDGSDNGCIGCLG